MEDDFCAANTLNSDESNEESRRIAADKEKKIGIMCYLRSAALSSLFLAVSIAGYVLAYKSSTGRLNNFYHTFFSICLVFFGYLTLKNIRHLFEWLKYHKENPGERFGTFKLNTLYKDTHGGR